MEHIQLRTQDGITIAGIHYRRRSRSPGVLLLHMLPATKEWWDEFAKKLYKAGFGVLAIDLRGHGESEGGPGGYRLFSEEQTKMSIEDVRAGIAYQKAERHHQLFVVGASIGANLALQILAEDSTIRAAILISPGLNYHGIETIPFAKKILGGQSVFIIASKDDERTNGNAALQAQEIFNAVATNDKDIEIFEQGGHGTDLLLTHPDFAQRLIEWMKGKML